jgi:signal transduction histidine kinase/phage shock protein PspC (stress-responsive transcriptional regulator)
MARTESRHHSEPAPTGRHAAPSTLRIARSPSDRILTGTAGGLAERIGIDAVVVRLAFVVLTFAAGIGVVAYLVLWGLSVEPRPGAAPNGAAAPGMDAAQRTVAFCLVVAGALFILRGLGAWLGDAIVVPVALGAVGSALIWSRADRESRARWSRAASRFPRRSVDSFLSKPILGVRLVVGAGLIVGGMAVFLAANDAFAIHALRNVLFAVAVTVAGAALILGPGMLRLVRQLSAERRERIRSEERAEVAAHLHDSVLQSLAMIQRSQSADEMATLARAQERELRAWLYGGGPPPRGTLRAAVEEAAARVEALHHVEVEVVQVGDVPMDERSAALAQAVAEAMTNAARHAGVRRVSAYVEVEPDTVVAYVRDRGNGFDPTSVPEDRRGIADSILGRMERAGGTAEVLSTPGDGTEVALRLPRNGQ